MTHPTEDERKALQAWKEHAKSENIDLSVRGMVVSGECYYEHEYSEGCYKAFLAAWQAQSERIKVLEDALRGKADGLVPCVTIPWPHYMDLVARATNQENPKQL